MPDQPKPKVSLSVVIPCYNEELRLSNTIDTLLKYFTSESTFSLEEILIINDGSTDKTLLIANRFAESFTIINVLNIERNIGKGAAVKSGLEKTNSDWILIADADGATPWNQLISLANYCNTCEMIIGSRSLDKSKVIASPLLRKILRKVFNFIVRRYLWLDYKDTQCGFKLIKNTNILRHQILPLLTIRDFAWDVELIVLMENFKQRIVEAPIIWRHQKNSSISIIKHGYKMLLSLHMIRKLKLNKLNLF